MESELPRKSAQPLTKEVTLTMNNSNQIFPLTRNASDRERGVVWERRTLPNSKGEHSGEMHEERYHSESMVHAYPVTMTWLKFFTRGFQRNYGMREVERRTPMTMLACRMSALDDR